MFNKLFKKNSAEVEANSVENTGAELSVETEDKPKKKKRRSSYYGSYGKYSENARLIGSSATNKVPFAVVEAYKNIRIRLISALNEIDGKVAVVTSPNAAEGKSTTAVNIAITMSQLNKKVILIDSDLRRATINKKLHLKNEVGCSDVLNGRATAEEAIQAYNPNLDVLISGSVADNPSELFSSPAFDRLLSDLRDKYDYIIIDTPPINLVSDTLAISQKCDGVVLIARVSVTAYSDFRAALNNLKQLNVKVLGAVINGIGATKKKYNNYYKNNYYAYYR